MLDAHCHIDLFPDPPAIVAEADRLGIRTIAVTNAPSVFSHTRELTAGSRHVRAAIGLHPELVHSHGHELDLFWPHLERTRYVGEVGLDYVTTDAELRARQRRIFEAIVERCAALGDKILTIHSRRSAADVIATIGPTFRGKVILHWFSGTPRQLDQAAAAGCYFSVNPSMMSSQSGRTLAASMPRDRVLTETDGPFVKLNRRSATPRDSALAVKALSELWRVEPEEARDLIVQNLRTLLAEPQDTASA